MRTMWLSVEDFCPATQQVKEKLVVVGDRYWERQKLGKNKLHY